MIPICPAADHVYNVAGKDGGVSYIKNVHGDDPECKQTIRTVGKYQAPSKGVAHSLAPGGQIVTLAAMNLTS